MINFELLNNPAHLEKMRKERENAEDELRKKLLEQRNAAENLLDQEFLTDKERSFVRSCMFRLNTYGELSEAQIKWLFDLRDKHSN